MIPEDWDKGYKSMNFCNKPKGETAGAPSGYNLRFEFYNKKLKEPQENTTSSSKKTRPYTTQNNLRAHRKKVAKVKAESFIEKYNQEHPYFIDQNFVQEKPKRRGNRPQTVKEKRNDKTNYYRVKNGLNKHTTGINLRNSSNYGNSISLKCKHLKSDSLDVENPKLKTKNQLQMRRLSDSKKPPEGMRKERTLKDFDKRVEEKENSYFRMNYQQGKRKTRSKMVQQRTIRENEYNKNNFKQKIQGVNGPNIPSFYKTDKMWWKKKDRYIQNPKNISQGKVLQDNKLCSRNDMILLADFSTNEAPQQPFKEHLVMKNKKDQVTEKPNANKNFKKIKNAKRHKGDYIRWSEKQGRILS